MDFNGLDKIDPDKVKVEISQTHKSPPQIVPWDEFPVAVRVLVERGLDSGPSAWNTFAAPSTPVANRLREALPAAARAHSPRLSVRFVQPYNSAGDLKKDVDPKIVKYRVTEWKPRKNTRS